jgi:hypothetical protein
MEFFDISLDWAILAPFPVPPAAEDLARCIAALRKRDGLGGRVPPILDSAGPAPEDTVPIIVLNMENSGNERGGYTWRCGRDRVEIYGDSRRGFCNGVYSFLAALGFSWPDPGREIPPPAPAAAGVPHDAPPDTGGEGLRERGIYPLRDRGLYVQSNPVPENRCRLVVLPGTPNREIPALGRWAARNQVGALIFSLRDRGFSGARNSGRANIMAELENDWGLIIEWGGWDLSFLIPRHLFLFRRELFRMEGGKRMGDHHFCPTNPETIVLLRRRMDRFLARRDKARGRPEGAGREGPRRIYHLWPDRGAEDIWCACPACRAFMPREQIRLAVSAAAAVIGERDPQARLSCRGEEESPVEKLPGGSEIALSPNVFRLRDRSGEVPVYVYEEGRIKEIGPVLPAK